MRTACGQPCSTVAQLALPVALPYSSPSHSCIRGLMPHHSCFHCVSSGRGPGSGRGYQPHSSWRPSGSGRGRGALCSSGRGPGFGRGCQPRSPGRTVRLPALDEGPFLSGTQGSSAPPGEGRAPAAGANHAPPGRGSFSVQNSGFFG